MILKGSRLEFISWIKRDGSGTESVTEEYAKTMNDDKFEVNCLSLSENTHIASGFNSFVVKIKKADITEKQLTPMQEFYDWIYRNGMSPDCGIPAIKQKAKELMVKEKEVIITFANKLVEIQVEGCGCFKNGSMEEESEELFKKIFEIE
ncbi:MAG: hypothetical protein IPJ01_11400 [Micavibrio sp.]|nr:hypothetical protein [Micavibrio sp.]